MIFKIDITAAGFVGEVWYIVYNTWQYAKRIYKKMRRIV